MPIHTRQSIVCGGWRMRDAISAIKRALKLSRDDRLMFYRLLSSQIAAGIVPARACVSLTTLDGLPNGVRDLAKAGAQAESQSRPVTEGFAATGLLPPLELGVLTIADQNGQLREALDELSEAAQDAQIRFFSSVIRPNLYYGLVVTFLLVFVWKAEAFFAALAFASSANPLVDLSIALKVWLLPMLTLVAAAAIATMYGMQRWIGPQRRFLGPFDLQARLQFSIRFLDLAGMMARRGAANTRILEGVIRVYGNTRYLQYHARTALQALSGRGEEWESALSRGLLPPDHADLLKGLVPGGAREMYPGGYKTIATLQRQILRQKFQRMSVWLKMLLIIAVMYLLSSLAEGMVGIFDSVQNL